MIDLEHAAAELIAAGTAEPDVAAVRGRADRRRRRRRVAGGLAAALLLAASGAAAAQFAADDGAREAVVTGTAPDAATTTTDPEPRDPWAASQPVDLGGLRVLVPADWSIIDAATDPGGGCGDAASVVLGDQAQDVFCPQPTALRMGFLQEPLHGGGEDPQTRNGIELVRLSEDPVIWAAPELGVRLTFGPGVDTEQLLGTIQRTPGQPDAEPEIGAPRAIVLPCGTVVVDDRSVLLLPEGLDVELAEGMGGWAPGTDLGPCAVNLTDPGDPARHITFAAGPLPYGLGEELGGVATREAGLRWGTIEDGYGGEHQNAAGDTVHVLAYGIDEDEAAALFTSLATALGAN